VNTHIQFDRFSIFGRIIHLGDRKVVKMLATQQLMVFSPEVQF